MTANPILHHLKTSLVILLLALFPVAGLADGVRWIPPDRADLDTILNLMYNMEVVAAEKRVADWKNRYPHRPEGYFLDGMILWIQVFVDIRNPFLDNEFQTKMDEVIKKCEEIEKTSDSLSIVARYYKSGAIGFKAQLYGLRDNWFSAARYGISALDGITESLEGKFANIDARYGAGLYYYYAEFLPDRYPIIKPLLWFYPSGDKKRGLELLQSVADSGMFANVEAQYSLGMISYFYEKNYAKAIKVFANLNNRFPKNSRYLFYRGQLAYQMGDYQQADSCMAVMEGRILANRPFYYTHQLRYIYYIRGMIAEYSNRPTMAYSFYQEALAPVDAGIHKETEHYYVYCLLRSANMLIKMGYPEEAKPRFYEVLRTPEYSNSHRRAREGLAELGVPEDTIRVRTAHTPPASSN